MQKNYNEEDLLKAIAGSYQPSFLQIKLTHSFDGGFAKFSKKQLGTFLHEYVHFLQNVSTPWGLYMSMVQYQTLANTYAFIEASTEELELPLCIRTDELKRKWDIINLGSGYYPFAKNDEYLCRKIDRTKKINVHRCREQIGQNLFPKVSFDITFVDGSTRTIDFGAIIIYESMAAMYQMMVDPTATHENNDLPYNLIQILCEQLYPNIAGDRKKLISICYISLFSMYPAEVLFDQLDYASRYPCVSGEDLFFEFVKNSKIRDNKGLELNVEDFMDKLVDMFKTLLSKVLDTELDYIDYVLEQVRVSKHQIPLLSVIHQQDITPELFEGMVNVLGLPFTYNDQAQVFLPKSIRDPSKDSEDMLRLIQNWALFKHITAPNDYFCCPLKPLCLSSNPPIEKDECFDFPWEGKECPITTLTNYIGLKGKKFKWNYSK